jgi:hypothetical protein
MLEVQGKLIPKGPKYYPTNISQNSKPSEIPCKTAEIE